MKDETTFRHSPAGGLNPGAIYMCPTTLPIGLWRRPVQMLTGKKKSSKKGKKIEQLKLQMKQMTKYLMIEMALLYRLNIYLNGVTELWKVEYRDRSDLRYKSVRTKICEICNI